MHAIRSALALACAAAPIALPAAGGAADGSGASGDVAGEVAVVRRAAGSRVQGPQDAVVYLENAPAVGAMPRGPFVVEQVGKAFDPAVLVVPVGATVEFPNHDIYHHNIFSLSPAKKFDLGLYEPGATRSVTFDRPGVVSIYCNIHPQMLGYILVVSNPFFTRAASNGSFVLRGVPAGTYRLVAWFPFGPAAREEVRVTAGQRTRVRLVVRERADAARDTPGDRNRPAAD